MTLPGAFGARGVPKVMKAIEMLGIDQGRQWELATLNEFRVFFKLEPYSTFCKCTSKLLSCESTS
jgi:hypothetical protein